MLTNGGNYVYFKDNEGSKLHPIYNKKVLICLIYQNGGNFESFSNPVSYIEKARRNKLVGDVALRASMYSEETVLDITNMVDHIE